MEELRLAKEELETERERLQESSDVGWARLYKIRDKVEGYETLLREKEAEIQRLKAVNEELLSERVRKTRSPNSALENPVSTNKTR